MATKSILKTVYIKDNDSAKNLARALENAHNTPETPVKFSRAPSDASRDEIRKMFAPEGRT